MGSLGDVMTTVEDLAWIHEESERAPIDAVRGTLREALGSQLDDLPADLVDDLQICRFLRGHNNNPHQAAVFMTRAIEYRRNLIGRDCFSKLRAAIGSNTHIDLQLVPHAEKLL